MNDLLQQWLQRKLTGKLMYLSTPVTVSHTYHVTTGPRYIFGKVTLAASPAETFAFSSEVSWPDRQNDDLVLDGILDVLLSQRHEPILGATFVLTAIGWHDVDSVPIGYYFASREATKRMIQLDDGRHNFSFSVPAGIRKR